MQLLLPLPASTKYRATSKTPQPVRPIEYQQLTYVSPTAAKVIRKGQPSEKKDGAGNAIGNATAPHVRAAEHVAPALVISKERGGVRIDKVLVPGLRIMDAGHAAVIGLNWHYFFLRCLASVTVFLVVHTRWK